MSPLLLVLLLVGAATAASRSRGDSRHWAKQDKAEQPACFPFNYTCGLIAPSPPVSYEAHIEHVDLLYDKTHYLEEFYHFKENVLAITDAWDTTFLHSIFYFDLNVAVFMATERGREDGRYPTTCTVSEISHDTLFHPFPGVNDTLHLVLAPSHALLFGNDYRYTYVDNETVRWMKCNRWDACITTESESFYVNYDWTDPSLTLDIHQYTSERPTQIRMTGHAKPPQGSTEMVKIDSLYTVGFFDDSPEFSDIRWAFEIPNEVYCEGFPSVKSPPSKLSSTYSMRVEVTFQATSESRQEYMSTVKNWYNFYHRLTREDSITNPATQEFAVAGLVQAAVIRDFKAGVEYIIDKSLGNCTTLVLDGEGYDTITTPDGQYKIKDPLYLFGLEEGANLTYKGMKYARGLPCDVWSGHLDFEIDNTTIHEAFVYEIYFLQSGWREDAGTQEEKYPVPVFISIHQDFSSDLLPHDIFVNLKQNIFKFEEESPVNSVYDITPCFFGHEHIRRFQMAFSATFRDAFDNNPIRFTTEVQDALLIYLEIPAIRLQHIQIEYVELYNQLYCEFTLVDQPQVEMQLPPTVGKPLGEVVQLLKNSMSFIIIMILDEHDQLKLMRPVNDSLKEMFEDGCYSRHESYMPSHHLNYPFSPVDHSEVPSSLPHHSDSPSLSLHDNDVPALPLDHSEGSSLLPHQLQGSPVREDEIGGFPFDFADIQKLVKKSDEKKYKPGDMAGMAVGMLLLGVLLGVVAMLVILNKMGLSNNLEFIPLSTRS